MKKNFISPIIRLVIVLVFIGLIAAFGYTYIFKYKHENKILKQVIERLEADSRVAEVLVTEVKFDEEKKQNFTTIKFLEYDSHGTPLKPRYYTFSGNIIQFQALVIRFDDIHVRKADELRGRSAFLFWKVFMLDGKNTQEYVITKENQIPDGYKVADLSDVYEQKLWKSFWEYALNPQKGREIGIKNAQIEAPGTMFVPGVLYTIMIEHDGGLRIDPSRLSPILRGERII